MLAVSLLLIKVYFMNRQARKAQPPLIFFAFLMVLSFACRSVTITIDNNSPASESVVSTQQIGFDFSQQVPSSPKGDISARRHLFLHEYSMPSNGSVTGIIFFNPVGDGYRIDVSIFVAA